MRYKKRESQIGSISYIPQRANIHISMIAIWMIANAFFVVVQSLASDAATLNDNNNDNISIS